MTVSEINPYVRYAVTRELDAQPVYSYSYDCRLFYLHEGRLTFHYQNETHEIEGGTMMIWPSGRRYLFEIEGTVPVTLLNFDWTQEHPSESALPIASDTSFEPSRVLERVKIDDCPELCELLILRDMRAAESELSGIVTELREQKRYFREYASASLKRLLTAAARGTLAGSMRTDSAVERVIVFITENYARPITNREISEHVNYHEYYINTLMQRQTGMTLHRYLMSVRVQNACKLLEGSDLPMNKIAELCGFASAAHFSGAFRRLIGESPAEYRKRRRGLI